MFHSPTDASQQFKLEFCSPLSQLLHSLLDDDDDDDGKKTNCFPSRSSSRSSSRSPSPEDPGKVEFITEFSHDNTAHQPSKKPDGDSQSHTSSSRSVHFTLLSSPCVLLFRLTVRTWRFLRYFLLILPSLIIPSADYQRLS